MKIAILGSRSFSNYLLLKKCVNDLLKAWECDRKSIEIVSGGAAGADKLADCFAKSENLKLTLFLPEWSKYGRKAGLVRNRQIADYADVAIFFWDGKSTGTKFTIELFKSEKKKIRVIRYEV